MPNLPVVQYNQIKPAEYNAVQSKVAAVMGTPTVGVNLELSNGTTVTTDATWGYNQTLDSSQVAVNQSITAKHIYDLRKDILRARYHQQGNNSTYQNNSNSLIVTYVNTTATAVIPGGNVLLNSIASGSNILTLNQSGGVYAGGPIVFSQTVGGLTAGTVYYIDQLLGNNQITIKTSVSGPAVSPVLTNTTGLNVNASVYGTLKVGTSIGMTVGGALLFSGTAFSSLVDGTTYYVLLIVDDTTIVLSDVSNLSSAKTLTQGTGSMNILGTGSLASRYKLVQFTDLNTYSSIADAAISDRLSADSAQILPDAYTKERNGTLLPWGGYNQGQSLTQTITIDFGTANAATAHWNAGGYIDISATMSSSSTSPSNSKNLSWQQMFNAMGNLRIRRSSVDRSNTTGSGVTLVNTLGWINLTTAHQQIVSVTPSAAYAQNLYTVTAKRLGPSNAPTGLEIIIKYWDLSNFYAYYSDVRDYVGGQVINPGGGISTGVGRVDESVDGTLTTLYSVYRSQGLNGVSIPSPTVTSTDLTIGDPLPTFTVSASTYTVSEGGTVRFTVNATNFAGTTVYYSIDTSATSIANGFPSAADFQDNTATGSITLTSGSGFVDKVLANDTLTEGLEVIYFRVRTVSTTGLIVANCAPVNVSDTSLGSPPPPPTFPPVTPPAPPNTPPPTQPVLSARYVELGLQTYGSVTDNGVTTNQRLAFAVQIDNTITPGLTNFICSLTGLVKGSLDTVSYNINYRGNGNAGTNEYPTATYNSTIYWLVVPPNYGDPSATAGAKKGGFVQIFLSRSGYVGWTSPQINLSNWFTSGPAAPSAGATPVYVWTTSTSLT